MTMKRRLLRLETKQGGIQAALDMIVISMVAPGPNGPVHLGPHSARILTGHNAGTEVMRCDDESAEAFEARCDAVLRCGSCP